MTLRDNELKHLYQSYVASKSRPDRKACPSWKAVSDFFENRTRTGRKLKIVDHVTSCSACAEEFEFLRQVWLWGKQIAHEVERQRPPSPSGRVGVPFLWRYSSVAAGVLLALASLAIIIQNWSHPGITRAAPSAVVLTTPNQKRPASLPLTFEWEEFKGAGAFVLELFDEALLPVWKSPETRATRIVLPEEIGRRLPSNRRYFWMITAYRGGDRIAESALLPFVLTSKGR
ncbi:MAG TPA: hypothetical protein VMS75_02915 [Terriglobales bacterium]|nr:hypothetical protein [Terriglobales bacterium]